MSKRTHFALAVSLIVAFAVLTVGPSPARAQNFFQKNDRNGDGRLSPEEFPGPPQAFTHMDRDGDGFLAPKEMRQARDQRSGPSSQGSQQQRAPMQGQGRPGMRETAPAAARTGPLRFVDTHMHLHLFLDYQDTSFSRFRNLFQQAVEKFMEDL